MPLLHSAASLLECLPNTYNLLSSHHSMRAAAAEAVKPEGWSEEEDGQWVAPLIANPKCRVGCGPWQAPLVKNPKYKVGWSH